MPEIAVMDLNVIQSCFYRNSQIVTRISMQAQISMQGGILTKIKKWIGVHAKGLGRKSGGLERRKVERAYVRQQFWQHIQILRKILMNLGTKMSKIRSEIWKLQYLVREIQKCLSCTNKTESKFSPRSRAKELLKFIKLFKPFKLCRICPILSCFRQYNVHKINLFFSTSKNILSANSIYF